MLGLADSASRDAVRVDLEEMQYEALEVLSATLRRSDADEYRLPQFEVAGTSWSLSPRREIEGAVLGGSIEVAMEAASWEVFSASGRVIGGVREARYWPTGQFDVASKWIALHGEYTARVFD